MQRYDEGRENTNSPQGGKEWNVYIKLQSENLLQECMLDYYLYGILSRVTFEVVTQ